MNKAHSHSLCAAFKISPAALYFTRDSTLLKCMHCAVTYYSFVLNSTGLIKTWALRQVSATSHILIDMGTYAQMQDEYFSQRIFSAYLGKEQVGFSVISGSVVVFNNTHHTAIPRLLWNIDCFQESSTLNPSDISPISKEQRRTFLPKRREKYTESIAHWLPLQNVIAVM